MLNFALIGAAGYIAPKHMKAIKDTGNNLSVIFDINDSVGIIDNYYPNCEFFKKYEGFNNYIKNLQYNEKKKIDYISICSPNHLHLSHITSSLKLGCNTICEKPLVGNLDDVHKLKELEKETGKKIFNILQLRYHKTIKNLKKEVEKSQSKTKFEVELTYITSRGSWYYKSWKNNFKKSFGIVSNIGIHFFDMLQFIFGKFIKNSLFYYDNSTASGFLEFEKANVKWFLSVDKKYLPKNLPTNQTTFRNIKIFDKVIEFSDGFTDLHSESYKKILNEEGYGISEVEPSIEIVENINNQKVTLNNEENFHFLIKETLK